MKICNLGSGSKGNSTLVMTENTRILIDAGFSYAEMCKRLEMANVLPKDIDAVFVSHEHIDHVRALDVFSSKHKTKIYANADCWKTLEKKCPKINDEQKIAFFDNEFSFSDLTITPVRLSHDASSCHGFCVVEKEKKFAILTDLGQTNDRLNDAIRGSSLVFVEANHDRDMLLANPNYPSVLKRRILSQKGHLSNVQCGESLAKFYSPVSRVVMLAHLSEENNTPEIAIKTVRETAIGKGCVFDLDFKMGVCRQDRPSPIFNLK